MSVVAVEVTVPPEWAAGIAALAALTAIEVAAIRWGIAPISPLIRYNVHKHPVAAAGIAVLLGLHFTFEFRGDPLGWAARRIDRRRR